jgi:hypothetical protein
MGSSKVLSCVPLSGPHEQFSVPREQLLRVFLWAVLRYSLVYRSQVLTSSSQASLRVTSPWSSSQPLVSSYSESSYGQF